MLTSPAIAERPPGPIAPRGNAPRNRRRFNQYSIAGIALVIVYVLIYAFFRESLPEKWSVDSAKIIEILNYGGAGGDLDNSFAVTAALFGLIGVDNLDIFTCLVSALFLFFATHDIRRAGDFFSRLLLIAPCIMLNMFAPSKETVVLIMTMFITVSAIYFRTSKKFTFASFLFLYVVYGIFVRQYYLLIVGVFFAVYWLWRRPLKYHLLAAVIAAGAIWRHRPASCRRCNRHATRPMPMRSKSAATTGRPLPISHRRPPVPDSWSITCMPERY
jgi:magnesium-transporting ATPase (P-type)